MFYAGAIAIGSGFFGNGLVTAGVTGVECTGEETVLSECELEHIPMSGICDQDAEIICRGNGALFLVVHLLVIFLATSCFRRYEGY